MAALRTITPCAYRSTRRTIGDGFYLGDIQINGVRAIDPTVGAWTTPDAYEGDVHDPMSQQKYMFNRNNGIDYSDPTGFESYIGINPGGGDIGGRMGHEMAIIVNPQRPNEGTLYSWRPSSDVKSGKNLIHTPGTQMLRRGL
jgi:hypothetical protein